MKKKFLLILSTFLCGDEPYLKVGLLINQKNVYITHPRGVYIQSSKVKKLHNGKVNIRFYSPYKIKIKKRIYRSLVKIFPNGNFLYLNGKKYRGTLLVNPKRNGFNVINYLKLEEYLYGVLPAEVPSKWPLEALKAQAVAARTIVFTNFQKHLKNGYNLCGTYCCQIYKGMGIETTSTNQAVDLTRGEVLVYKGKLISAVYHSTCGGMTESASEIWSLKEYPYLKSIKCKYCKSSPYYQWKTKLKISQIQEVLEKNKINLKIKDIKLEGRTKSDRVRYIVINNKYRIKAFKFRLMLGPFLLRSCKIRKLKSCNEIIEISGSGFGHGVGMCQWGARGLAKTGKNYKEILSFYYPGTKVIKKY